MYTFKATYSNNKTEEETRVLEGKIYSNGLYFSINKKEGFEELKDEDVDYDHWHDITNELPKLSREKDEICFLEVFRNGEAIRQSYPMMDYK